MTEIVSILIGTAVGGVWLLICKGADVVAARRSARPAVIDPCAELRARSARFRADLRTYGGAFHD
ncbi:hypothetical protein AB0H03_06515 [Streptomyces sparsogenes]|uniref:hypothetical protein n=1 Tax=Streptomyces sparsogenes TaxID=67365 RepID=UPI0033D2B689